MIKNEKGSITLFTLIAMMFFLTIAFTSYASAMSKLQAQNDDLERIKASYEQDLTEEGLASLYEELTTKKPYTVTFDANGGRVDLASKEVKYGKEYGNLPTPTRDGYKFMGWNGRNIFNYDKNEYYQQATIKENEEVYKRNINYSSSNIWPIFFTNKKNIELKHNQIYTISFYIWSDEETTFTQNRFFVNNSTTSVHNLSSITQEKQRLISTVTYTENESWPNIIHIYPRTSANNNIYISNIQIEEGAEATEYEPYYITNDTKVTQKNDHVLKAIWAEGVPPTLELSKETYIEEDFSDWSLSNAKIIEEDGAKVLVLGENENNFSAQKKIIVNKEKHYFTFDAYTSSVSPLLTPKGGFYIVTNYYDNNNNVTNETTTGNNYTSNAWAKGITLNIWENFRHSYGTGIYGFDKVSVNFISSINAYSVPPLKIKNFVVHGEAIPNSFYNINITSSDNVGVTTTKYAKGEQTKEYFETNGINVENNQIRVTENGIYTVCVGDKAGNMTIKTIEITNIQ